MKKINVGLIGYGYWGPNYARLLSTHTDVNFVAVSDLSPEFLKEAKLKHNVEIFKDYKKILSNKNIEAVLIITPTISHFQIAKDALEFGKHVLIEKPLTKTAKEAKRLIKLAAKNNLVLMVGHTFLYNDHFKKVEEVVKNGKIGLLRFITATRINLGPIRRDVNVKWDLAPHDIAMILKLVGKMPEGVMVAGGSYLSHKTDVAFINLKFPNNVLANITVSWLAPVKSRQLIVVGSKKMVVFDDVSQTDKVAIYNKGVMLPRGSSFSEFSKFGIYNEDTEIPKIKAGEPLLNKLNHFLECIAFGKSPLTDGHNGLEVVSILEACDQSFETNKYVKVKL
jgi:predicted dehydrogenase